MICSLSRVYSSTPWIVVQPRTHYNSKVLQRLHSPIKALVRGTARAYLGLRERYAEPPRVVWILAHMRSGSSLLQHLLISHPRIFGCGERNATYGSERDLDRLAVDVYYRRRELWRRYPLLVDQINHDRFLIDESLLDHPRVCPIFLIRRPEDAVASMVDVLGRHYGMTRQQAVDYYVERLDALARYAELCRHAFFLTYEDLLENTREILADLTTFLELKSPLVEQYQTFSFTGRSGDPSPRIHSGRVVTEPSRPPLELTPDELTRLHRAHEGCVRRPKQHCWRARVE